MKLLLFSNSSNAGEEYLQHASDPILNFLKDNRGHAVFIPYAAVSIPYDEYTARVKRVFHELRIKLTSIHNFKDQRKIIRKASVIVVGGGNTFHLLKQLQDRRLINSLRKKILTGTPYIGWSAGSNITCPTIMTTNDMPVVEPKSFKALNLIPFQINPHFLDRNPDGFGGETREDRIHEFTMVNKDKYVLGLREGTWLELDNNRLLFKGIGTARIFKNGINPLELSSRDSFDFLLGTKNG